MLESNGLGQHAVYIPKKRRGILEQLYNYQLTNSVLLSWCSQFSLIILSVVYNR